MIGARVRWSVNGEITRGAHGRGDVRIRLCIRLGLRGLCGYVDRSRRRVSLCRLRRFGDRGWWWFRSRGCGIRRLQRWRSRPRASRRRHHDPDQRAHSHARILPRTTRVRSRPGGLILDAERYEPSGLSSSHPTRQPLQHIVTGWIGFASPVKSFDPAAAAHPRPVGLPAKTLIALCTLPLGRVIPSQPP